MTLHAYKGNKLYARTYTAPAVPAFFDSGPNAYWDSRVPYNSVQTPGRDFGWTSCRWPPTA